MSVWLRARESAGHFRHRPTPHQSFHHRHALEPDHPKALRTTRHDPTRQFVPVDRSAHISFRYFTLRLAVKSTAYRPDFGPWAPFVDEFMEEQRSEAPGLSKNCVGIDWEWDSGYSDG